MLQNKAEGNEVTIVYPQLITGADLLQSIIKLNELAPLLKRRGATSVAIVNSRLYGVRSFYQTMKAAAIHPVFGVTIFIELPTAHRVKAYVYARNATGYSNLLKLSSAEAIHPQATVKLSWLKAYSEGCSIVCPLTHTSWKEARNENAIQSIAENIERDFLFIGIERPFGQVHEDEQVIIRVATELQLRITATYENRFLMREHEDAYRVATAIRQGYKYKDVTLKTHEKAQFVVEEHELPQWFADVPQWLDNAKQLLHECQVSLPEPVVRLPKFPLKTEKTSIEVLTETCFLNLERKSLESEAYVKRLQWELQVIEEMGFADYFLIVADYIQFAKKSGILTGPGRGSSSGSLVSFALGITEVDPLRYRLLFERFLNPERISLPDIDVDFADNRRHEVIQYVANKYGKNYVAQIITFGTLSTKAVARNVARVLDFSASEITFISNEIPNRGIHSLEEAVKRSVRLQQWIAMEPVRHTWYTAALQLEGLPRNASTHAAGVIISDEPLVTTVPVQDGGDDVFMTQWAMEDVEQSGLLKMDFLGLRNLTLLHRMVKISNYHDRKSVKLEELPLTDKKTMQLFQSGNMTGIFQFESPGMREALMRIQPTTFEDLYAISALYRPGPMEFIPLYQQRKHGEQPIRYIVPKLEKILAETFGIIVYQEQIMEIAVHIARFSFSEADHLRRAISKKQKEDIMLQRERFLNGAIQNGYTKEQAIEVFELIVKFGDYGFPKSHAVAYTLISYRLAYFKANKPAVFYAALLSQDIGNSEKTMEIMLEMKSTNIRLLPPSIRKSSYYHTVEDGAVRIGLHAIKGVTRAFYETVLEAKSKSYTTFFEWIEQLTKEQLSPKVLEALIQAGALDEFGEKRADLLASIDIAINDSKFKYGTPIIRKGMELSHLELLEMERQVLGFYLSEHPAERIKQQSTDDLVSISNCISMAKGAPVRIVGIQTGLKKIRTKKGEPMAFLTIQDETGSISCTLFPTVFVQVEASLNQQVVLLIDGVIDIRNGQSQIVVEKVRIIQ